MADTTVKKESITTETTNKTGDKVVNTLSSGWPEYEKIVAGSNYSLRPNVKDHSNVITDLYYYGEPRRKLGFCVRKKDNNLLVFSKTELYEKLCKITKMPERLPNKPTQPHFILSRSEFAEVLKLIVKYDL